MRFKLRCEGITTGRRCNCSICIRKGAVMSARYFAPEEFEELAGLGSLSLYQFGDHDVNRYFCSTCGIYPFHDGPAKPGSETAFARCPAQSKGADESGGAARDEDGLDEQPTQATRLSFPSRVRPGAARHGNARSTLDHVTNGSACAALRSTCRIWSTVVMDHAVTE